MRSISPFERHSEPVPVEEADARVHVFAAGERLDLLAHDYYGDWRLWLDIADFNAIADPRRIKPGTRLMIPPRRLELGRFESE